MIAEAKAFEQWLHAVTDDSPEIDAPFLPGKRVRIREKKAFRWPWDRGEKRLFSVSIDDVMAAVLYTATPDATFYICSDHDNYCDCKKVVAAYIATDPKE
jgi:hypothetical protein